MCCVWPRVCVCLNCVGVGGVDGGGGGGGEMCAVLLR